MNKKIEIPKKKRGRPPKEYKVKTTNSSNRIPAVILDIDKLPATTLLIMRICVALHDNKRLTSFLNSDEVNEKICRMYPDFINNNDEYDVVTKDEQEFIKMVKILTEDQKKELQRYMYKKAIDDFVYNKDSQINANMVRDILKESSLFL